MPDRENPEKGSPGLSDDLFSNLPEPSHRAPAVRTTPPVPGSRRELRERASREHAPTEAHHEPEAGEAAPQPDTAPRSEHEQPQQPAQSERPAQTATPRPAEQEPAPPAAAASSPSGTTLDDLFTSDPEDSGHHRSGKKKRRTGCIVALVIVLAVIGGVVAAGAFVWNTYGEQIREVMGWGEPKDWEPGQATGEALVTIREGDTGAPVSTALYEAGVTKTDSVFYDYLVSENLAVTFYPGVYTLQQKMTAADALEALQDPANKTENTVSIPEGGTVESSLPLITEGVGIPIEELEAAVDDPSAYGVEAESLEGWLFPAIYTFDPDTTADQVIQRMVDRTRESLAAAGVPDAEAERVLTIASIIQREGRTDDFAKVSRVIQNRIDSDMMLQMDSTAQYGYGELHAGVVSTSEEAQFDDNPWNTYVIHGLPKTPIANPADAAIDAAMHPADGPWLYFVTINPSTGETVFSTTYEEHQEAIGTWQEWCRDNPDQGC